MKEVVRRRARELGFDDCRFTTAAPPDSAPHFQQWLAQGQHGEMAYLQCNAGKRVAPGEVLPGAKSIVTLAASYGEIQSPKSGCRAPVAEQSGSGAEQGAQTDQAAADNALRVTPPARPVARVGAIARYARYQDYHDVLAPRLRELAEFIQRLGGPEARALWYVDTGPMLERDLAQRAGLGFIGKHTNLISRRLGNWTFLCEIITTIQFTPDEPERNHCGSCTRCMAACPTGAIAAPFQLDARRCLSYLTIELRGPIPLELRPALGNRIYGCDDCLEACPWNRFAQEGAIMRQHARAEMAAAELLELLALDDDGFKRRFAGTPILRVKRRGLLRNVCVALGNVGDEAAVPALQRAAQSEEPLIAEHARWATEQIKLRRA